MQHFDSLWVANTNAQSSFLFVRLCQSVSDHVQVIALLLALFMPDIWVLAGVNDTIFIDVAGAQVCITVNH